MKVGPSQVLQKNKDKLGNVLTLVMDLHSNVHANTHDLFSQRQQLLEIAKTINTLALDMNYEETVARHNMRGE